MLTINWKQKFKENIVEIERAVREIWTEIYNNKEEGDHLTLYLWYDNNLTYDGLAGIAIIIYCLEYDPDKKIEDFCFEVEMLDTLLYLDELEQASLEHKRKAQEIKKSEAGISEAKEKLRVAFEKDPCFWYDTFLENDWDCFYEEAFNIIDELYYCDDKVPEKELEAALKMLNSMSNHHDLKGRVNFKGDCTYAELIPLLDAHLHEEMFRENNNDHWTLIRFDFA